MSPPPLSVVMPVHDARPYLDESIASILDQTFGDFELVIRDDASTDGSRELLRAWAARDSRVRLHEGHRQLGPVGSSQWVVRQARGDIVARMDADDVAHRDRLRRQVEVLRAHRDVDLVGTLWDGLDDGGRPVRRPDRWRLARRSPFPPFPHTSIMFRRSAFDRVGGYRPETEYWEDLDLNLRMVRHGRVAVVAEPLVRVRHSLGSVRLRARDRVEEAYDGMFREIGDLMPRERSDPVRLVPQAVVTVAAIELWAGRRPRVIGRLLRRARLRPDRASGLALAWALWATVSPRSLRCALRLLHAARDLRVRGSIRDGAVYEWVPALGRGASGPTPIGAIQDLPA